MSLICRDDRTTLKVLNTSRAIAFFRICRLLSTTTLGLATCACLLGLGNLAFADVPQTQTEFNGRTMSEVNVLFVNSAVGDDTIGNGSERAPFKTISQALRVVRPNTVILLAPGTYSSASGETFPLLLKRGVSIQGDSRTKGGAFVISGGGLFLSPTFASQNVTILGATGAGLTGVTVTNPNPRGYGLWIESSSPIVIENTFTGNSHDGISMTGNSAPIIRGNHFIKNGANGVTIYGTSRPEVRENVFEQTGFGINIAQNAAPIVVGNRIVENRSGVVAQNNSQPVLRDNVIEGNIEDGVVAIAQARPDLGTAKIPGNNVFRQNNRFDINSSASSQVIPAFGNSLTSSRNRGNIDLTGLSELSVAPTSDEQLASTQSLPSPVPQADTTTAANQDDRISAAIPSPLRIQVVIPTLSTIPPITSTTLASPATTLRNSLRTAPATLPPATQRASIPISVPIAPQPQELSSGDISLNQPQQDNNRVGNTIEFVAPQTAKRSEPVPQLPNLESAPVGDSALLPVPSGNIPTSNSPSLPQLPSRTAYGFSTGTPTPAVAQVRYRVLVAVESAKQQALVRSLVKSAFRTVSNGRTVMQVGVFSDRYNADEMVQLLKSNGLRATIEQL